MNGHTTACNTTNTVFGGWSYETAVYQVTYTILFLLSFSLTVIPSNVKYILYDIYCLSYLLLHKERLSMSFS